MADTLALELFFNRVTAQFALDGTQVPILFGWREKNKHIVNGTTVGNKIIIVPGNEPGNGDVGKLLAPSKNVPDGVRSFGTLGELFTVYICGSDPTAPSNELAQYKVTRLLYDTFVRAAYLQAFGTWLAVTLNWDRTKTERQHGAMLIGVFAIEAMIPDTALTLAPVDTHAILTTTVLSQADPPVRIDPIP
jgi:hypothetical protein